MIKRKNQKEILDVTKIKQIAADSSDELDFVTKCELEIEAQLKFSIRRSVMDDIISFIESEIVKITSVMNLDDRLTKVIKEKKKRLQKLIIENIRRIKLIKSQIINQITFTFNNNYFNVYLFNIIGNNSSEKPNN